MKFHLSKQVRKVQRGYGKEVSMKLYLDTANVIEIGEAASLGAGWCDDKPVARGKRKDAVFARHWSRICHLVDGPVSAEVGSVEESAMIKEGKEHAKIHQNIVVKCPLTLEGLKATSC
jgi:transaldolase